MATKHEVTCITKRPSHYDPHERIQGIGGPDSTTGKQYWVDENKAIAGIEDGTWAFFVQVSGHEANVIVASHNGRKYLKTTPDGYAPNNLLNLPECKR